MSETCDVILVFVNEREKDAVYDVFKKNPNRDPVVRFGDVLTYHDFGTIGGAKVLGLQTEMGSIAAGGSAVAISEVINEKNPQYVILVGVAFGMDRKKQHIGDILVSRQLSLYEARKIAAVKKGEEIVDIDIRRGDTITAPVRLLGRFRALSGSNSWQGAPVHFGLMLSGEKLIDNPKFKEKLQKEYPEALGGEMEAAGAYAAASLKKRDWIVVKAVCDYADGNKKRNKRKSQERAAANAAQLVFHVLEKGNFGGVFSKSGPGKTPEEKKTKSSKAAIKKQVKGNIIKLLDRGKMERFRNALTYRLNEEKGKQTAYDIGQMAAILIDMSVLDAILILDLATQDCIEAINDAEGDIDLIRSTWDTGVSILGWLVLMGVDDEWADNASRSLVDRGEHLKFFIPVNTQAGAEIAFSRLKQDRAHLRIDETTRQVLGEKGIQCDDWNIEDGWHTPDKVLTIKRTLWKQLIKADPPGTGEFTKNLDAELNQTLVTRHKKGEHHYIAINQSCRDNPLLQEDVYRALINDLPDLEIFLIGSEEQGVAIIGEPQLHAQLREFFRNQPE
jgi:nucleoside phosphorylase